MIELLHETQRRALMAKFAKYAYMNLSEAKQAAKREGFNKTEFFRYNNIFIVYNNYLTIILVYFIINYYNFF